MIVKMFPKETPYRFSESVNDFPRGFDNAPLLINGERAPFDISGIQLDINAQRILVALLNIALNSSSEFKCKVKDMLSTDSMEALPGNCGLSINASYRAIAEAAEMKYCESFVGVLDKALGSICSFAGRYKYNHGSFTMIRLFDTYTNDKVAEMIKYFASARTIWFCQKYLYPLMYV